MKCIFWTCFGWVASCFMPHNKFIFCSTWISKTSRASLASSRARWLATQRGSMLKTFGNGIQPQWAKYSSRGKLQQGPEQEQWAEPLCLVWAPVFLVSRRLSYTTGGAAFQPSQGILGTDSLSHQITSESQVLSSLGQHPLPQANVSPCEMS